MTSFVLAGEGRGSRLRAVDFPRSSLRQRLGASTVPVEKDHTEEMVTQCIVEVLSNALSKPNAPPINPECKEILKKSDKNDRERSENKEPEVRHPKDPAETQKHPAGSVEKEQKQAEEESKKYLEGGDEEKLTGEEGKSREEEAGHHTPAQEETLHTEEKKLYRETGREEERNYHSEEESKEGQCCEDVEAAVVTKKSHSEGTSMEEFRGGNGRSPGGRWHLEEGMQSPSKQIREGEEGEEERSEKYHQESEERGFSHQQEREESEESEEREEAREPSKARGYHGKHGAGDSYDEKRGRGDERGEPGQPRPWEQWKHHQEQQEEAEEKGGSPGRGGPEELRDEERRDSWQQGRESREGENKRRQHSQERRQHEGSRHSEGRTRLAGEDEEELDGYLSVGGRSRSWNEEGERSQRAREHEGQAGRRSSAEDGLQRQRERPEKKHRSGERVENEEEEERFAEREEYGGHRPAEKEKRTAASYRPFYPLLWWKSRHSDKRDGAGERLLEGRERGRPALSERNLFPEYSDYEWWPEKQIQSALKHRRAEKRNPGRRSRYDKVDQLAQLLNYRKKSAELPELYSSGEDLKKHHVAGNERRNLSQRPLTEEEEKQLENLATMDLELQNIAEKINSLRRG
ncbi:secretogranin-1 isoform X1 [Hirundo rustica]|uniref:secretogranin-1 isoform X1 n=1 Tax=Hirundo rustica TaxID=43150 RepID=UPI001A941BC9|nr:secretogranin-1 isoform X1 [Hirundo rustica]